MYQIVESEDWFFVEILNEHDLKTIVGIAVNLWLNVDNDKKINAERY